jgi:cytochrome c oxidase subunit IV
VTEQTDVPQMQAGDPVAPPSVEHAHPGPRTYIAVAVWLALATAAEVALYYVDMPDGLFIGLLMFFMIVKFTTVVAYFMHLKYDARIFRRLMVTGIALAIAVYMIVLTTFGLFR